MHIKASLNCRIYIYIQYKREINAVCCVGRVKSNVSSVGPLSDQLHNIIYVMSNHVTNIVFGVIGTLSWLSKVSVFARNFMRSLII